MPNKHINANINKAIPTLTGQDISQDPSTWRTVVPSVETANKRLDSPPPLYIQ